MKKLDKADLAKQDDITTRLRDAKQTLETAVEKFNTAKDEAFNEVETAKDELNAILTDAREWRDDIVQQMDEYIGERSEKWQETDNGQRYGSWKDSFEGVELEEVELEKPEDLEMPDFNEESLRDLSSDPNEIF